MLRDGMPDAPPTGRRYTVAFGGFDLDAVRYDIAIPGAQQRTAGRLHLFDVADPAPAPASSIWWISCSRPRCSPPGT